MGADRAPRAYLLTYSAIPDDPRVRRVGDLLHANGWDVVGIGLSGSRSPAPAWPIRKVDLVHESAPAAPTGNAPETPRSMLGGVVRRSPLRPVINTAYAMARRPYHVALALGRRARHRMSLSVGTAEMIERNCFWPSYPFVRKMRDLALAEETPGLWLANDWLMLPVAAAAARAVGGSYIYDSHEFALEEYAQDANWRRNQRPVAAGIERRHIEGARLVTSVSPDITGELKRIYRLSAPTETIRNAPTYERHEFRPTGERIRVLYHGVVAPGRGLEESIDSVSLWRNEFDLTIRGPGSIDGYIEKLRERIRARGVEGRVAIVPSVPMTQLVSAATAFDVGLMALPGHSAHNRFALPNKIFEYMMAGLALCVSDLTSMRGVAETSKAGVLIADVTPLEIAAAINGLTRERVDAYKRAALAAAQTYNWETEGARLLAALARLARSTDPYAARKQAAGASSTV
jgi:glycosyltransferase involved in cell wall biosynthesis